MGDGDGGIEVVAERLLYRLDDGSDRRGSVPFRSIGLIFSGGKGCIPFSHRPPRLHQSAQPLFGRLKGLVGKVQRATVMRLQDEETDCHGRIGTTQFRVVTAEELRQGDEVAERFSHLLPFNGDHVVVDPVGHHLVALTGHGLSNLALMMRKDQVHAASVDVEVCAKVFTSHGGALTMPPRETIAPRRRPTHDVFGLCRFPEGKVRLILFLAHTGKVAAGIFHVFKTPA